MYKARRPTKAPVFSFDPSNVNITGGSINGTVIGNVTPAAGTFTALGANSISAQGGNLNGVSINGGAIGGAIRTVTGSTSFSTADFTIMCSTATQGFTVLLPLNPVTGTLANVKKASADANRLVIDGNGRLIDAVGTQSTILTTRPSFQMQFGSDATFGQQWAIL